MKFYYIEVIKHLTQTGFDEQGLFKIIAIIVSTNNKHKQPVDLEI